MSLTFSWIRLTSEASDQAYGMASMLTRQSIFNSACMGHAKKTFCCSFNASSYISRARVSFCGVVWKIVSEFTGSAYQFQNNQMFSHFSNSMRTFVLLILYEIPRRGICFNFFFQISTIVWGAILSSKHNKIILYAKFSISVHL